MKKTNMQWGVIATATVAMVGALASPQAMAKSKAKAPASEAYAAPSTNSRVDALEAQLQAMQAELSSLRASQNRPSAEAAKVQELDEWAQSVKAKPAEAAKDHLFAVRGGWMHFNDNRASTDTLNGALNGDTFSSDRDAFYYGGAIDFNMNNDLFGLMHNTSFGIELGVEYAHLADGKPNGVGGTLADVNQLRVSASPKVKFLHGNKFRPWLIPAGLDINIISPPSSSITVLNTGMQFGAGADYELFKGIVIGADGRYHHSFDNIDGVDTDGFTLGGSVGFKF
jgi:opacity protein-like surface antigen